MHFSCFVKLSWWKFLEVAKKTRLLLSQSHAVAYSRLPNFFCLCLPFAVGQCSVVPYCPVEVVFLAQMAVPIYNSIYCAACIFWLPRVNLVFVITLKPLSSSSSPGSQLVANNLSKVVCRWSIRENPVLGPNLFVFTSFSKDKIEKGPPNATQ